MGDHGGTLEAGVLGNAGEPAAEGIDIEMGERSGLAEAGDVGHHDPVVPRQTGDDRGPHGAAAFDATVEQQEGWAVAGLDDGGGYAVDVDGAGGGRQPGEHSFPRRGGGHRGLRVG